MNGGRPKAISHRHVTARDVISRDRASNGALLGWGRTHPLSLTHFNRSFRSIFFSRIRNIKLSGPFILEHFHLCGRSRPSDVFISRFAYKLGDPI